MKASPATVAEQIFGGSPYHEIRRLKCSFHEGELIIAGRVPNFFLKQLAQAAVKSLDGVQRINNQVEVR